MLIRRAEISELEKLGYRYPGSNDPDYSVLVAVDRMTEKILAALSFSRDTGIIDQAGNFVPNIQIEALDRLYRCAKNQVEPKGGSFHYNYPRYAKQSQ